MTTPTARMLAIADAVFRHNGNKSAAARELGVSQPAVSVSMTRYWAHVHDARQPAVEAATAADGPVDGSKDATGPVLEAPRRPQTGPTRPAVGSPEPPEGVGREPDTEAGAYIEDDPAAWASWVETVRRYVPGYYRELVDHLGTEDGAASIVGGAMLSYLADQHGLYLSRSPRAEAALLARRAPGDRERLPDEAGVMEWPGGGGRVTSMGDGRWLSDPDGGWVLLYAPRQFYDGLRALAADSRPEQGDER